ncbi:MAG: ethanolamine permease [Nannocystaceae bacterium]
MNAPGLQRRLGAVHLWSIAVGMVISGQYFGWNYGFAAGGTLGLLIAAALVTVYYGAFIFSYAELATAIPHAGGPSTYARRALGPVAGFLTGAAVLLEFGFAPPAIAVATGAYVHFLVPEVSAQLATILVFLAFLGVNLIGVGEAALVELVATVLALVGLVVFVVAGGVAAEFSGRLSADALTHGFTGVDGVLAAVPFAIWLYLGVEGAAMSAEEVAAPRRDIPRGFIAGILTLATCSVGTVLVTAGLGGGEGAPADYPLPQALASAYGAEHWLTRAVALIGLTGLVASLHGILMGLSRQTFALARAGYLPRFLARISTRGIPHWAVLVPGLFGVLCAGSAALSNALILLSVFGSVVMTCMSVVALLVLRRREPELARPYRVPSLAIPWSALVLGLGALYCVVTYALEGAELPWMGVTLPLPWVLMGLLAGAVGYYALVGRRGARAADGGG